MNNNTKSIIRYLLAFISIIVLALIDQYTKFLVVNHISVGEEIPVLGDAVVFTQLHNSGAAWSSFSGKIPFLLIITAIVSVLMIYVYIKLRNNDKFKAVRVLIVFILGGAIGNLIDRIRYGYVIDFIFFKIIHFPVFNFADICVTVSMFVLIYLFFFKYKSEEIDAAFNIKKSNSGTAKSDSKDQI